MNHTQKFCLLGFLSLAFGLNIDVEKGKFESWCRKMHLSLEKSLLHRLADSHPWAVLLTACLLHQPLTNLAKICSLSPGFLSCLCWKSPNGKTNKVTQHQPINHRWTSNTPLSASASYSPSATSLPTRNRATTWWRWNVNYIRDIASPACYKNTHYSRPDMVFL